jgi:hypothetical protein
VLAGKQAPSYYPFFQIDHPSKEGGFIIRRYRIESELYENVKIMPIAFDRTKNF